MSTVIKVENLSKQYRLGNVGLGSLGADVNRWWHTRILGNEDPYLKIGEENNREVIGNSEYVWALRDINFEVEQGEVLGIIGRNGAGKSTLLKILSRTTGPTTGSIKIKGRVASLLEVGTGFHPELTGRENIFLNGAILGMTKDEIRRKFDEIVAFAGVERYVDTPVKRYSSGMYVRLAFAVAAHLEPEILIVDEVLAVGDAEFQKKAIGKMKEVSEGQGRTVLFVSHNMAAVSHLCDKAILLHQGTIRCSGQTEVVVEEYKMMNTTKEKPFDFSNRLVEEKDIFIENFAVLDENRIPVNECFMGEKISFEFRVWSKINTTFTLRIAIFDSNENRVLAFDSADVGSIFNINQASSKTINCIVADNINLKAGSYRVNISLKRGAIIYDHIVGAVILQILEKDIYGFGRFSFSDMPIILKRHEWN